MTYRPALISARARAGLPALALATAPMMSGCAAADTGGPFFLGFFSELFSFLKVCMIGGFSLAFVFLVLVALPRSPLRDASLQALLWGIVLVSGFLAVSPADFIPLPLFPDDLLYVGTGLSASLAAIVQKLRQRREDREDARRARLYAYPPRVEAEYGYFPPNRQIVVSNPHDNHERTRHEHTTER